MTLDETNTIRIIVRAKNNLLLSKRESLGLTQLQMAEYCGVNLAAYSAAERLEYDNVSANQKNLKAIAEAVEISFEQLFPNWASLVGRTINSPDNYILLDDEYAKQKYLPNEFGDSPKLLSESFMQQLDKAIAESLNGREGEVIKMYFGINSEHFATLEEIGDRFNLTRERVRQIKERGIRRLRHSLSGRVLKEYLGMNFGEQND